MKIEKIGDGGDRRLRRLRIRRFKFEELGDLGY